MYTGMTTGNRHIKVVVAILGLLLLAGTAGLGQGDLQDAEIQVNRRISTYNVLSESCFVVTLRLETSRDLIGVGIAEVLPHGWTIDPVENDGAAFKRADNEWVFGEKISAGSTRELVYEISLPSADQLLTSQLPACFSIHGTLQARTPSVQVPIAGDSELLVGAVLPIANAVAHLVPRTEDAPDFVDLRMSKRIAEGQLIRALELWQTGVPVPSTGGETIDLAMMESLVAYYETCTAVDQPLPLAGEAELTAVRTLSTFLPCDSVLLPEACRDPGPNARRVAVAVTITALQDAYGVGLAESFPTGWRVSPVSHEGLWFRGSSAEWIYPKRLAAGETIQVLYEVEVADSPADRLLQGAPCCGWDGTIAGAVSSALGCGRWGVTGEEVVHVWDCLPVMLAISRWDTESDAIDVTLSDFVSFSQLQRAVAFWLEGTVVPHTCGFRIGYEMVKTIAGHWLTHTPVTRDLPDAPSGPCDDVELGCYVPAGSCEWFCELRQQQPQADFVAVPVISPPIADAGPDATLTCLVRSVTLEGSAQEGVPPYSYQWIDSEGATIATSSSVEVNGPGMYVLIVTSSSGCSGSDSVFVSEDVAVPAVDAGLDRILTCAVPEVTMTATVTGGTPPFVYAWTDVAGAVVGEQAQVTIHAPGAYTLTVTGSNGCTGGDTVIVTQDIESPIVRVTSDGIPVLTCANPQVTLTADVSGGAEPFCYAWAGSGGEPIGTMASVEVRAPGTYTVTVAGSNGCMATDTVVVT
ncbi:hypothetical protein JW848_09605, partial [Candidatus Bipolaricaulota bacterium]|nr:hypothetical protein [Candidatus Bipolaricaulota bacterium]